MFITPGLDTQLCAVTPDRAGKYSIEVYVMFDDVLVNAQCTLQIGSMTHTEYIKSKNYAMFNFKHFLLAGVELRLYVKHQENHSVQNLHDRTTITLKLLEDHTESNTCDSELFEDITEIIRRITALELKVESHREQLLNCTSMKLTLQSMAYSGSAFRSLLE